MSVTQQYAEKQAEKAVPDMFKTIATVKRYNRFVLIVAMAISYPHQVNYLSGIPGFSVGSWPVFAFLVPLAFDAAILAMVKTAQTVGMAKEAKRSAVWVLAFCVTVSGGVNAAAPGALGAKVIFALVVGLVGLVEYVGSRIAPDFAAIEARENETTAAAKPVARKCAEDCTCRRHARAKVLTPQQKAAITKAQRKADRELAEMRSGYVPADAPVSPALF